ncbi:restriction endonuclease subunit S [Streptomyces sp. NPDC019224]|uniref:restriction endonuclease subunit S n=1 Tax=Streptomyces sp. NPDC019224 TaxID=3154484 RepID=UPI00340C64FC
MSNIPLKYVARINAGQSPPSAEVFPLSSGRPFLQGNAEFKELHPLPRLECTTSPKVATRNDVLLSVRAPVGALNVADEPYGIGRGLCSITPTSCEGRFLWWWLHSQRPQLDAVSTGTTYKAVTAEDVGNLKFPNWSLQEQHRIAEFLDAETARIDRLADLQRKMIAGLNEREAAQLDIAIDDLISRAGMVPFRRFVWSVDQGTSPQCEAVPASEDEWGVLKVSCLRPGVFDPRENKRLPAEIQPDHRNEVREGDLLITRANTPQLVGSTAVVRQVRRKILLSDKIFRVRLSENISPEFVAAVARGSRVRSLSAAGSNGASSSMANIRFEEIKRWPMPAVSLSMQMQLVERVSRSRKQLDALRPVVNQRLALLAERRQALITAAVTGQFDVSTASGRNVTDGVPTA